MKKILNEIYGINPFEIKDTNQYRTNVRDTALGTNIDKTESPTTYSTNRFLPVDKTKFSWQNNQIRFFMPWQNEVYSKMIGGWNTIVSVPPAAGKSMPFLSAYFDELSTFLEHTGINGFKHSNCPRILYIAPTKQLCVEFYNTIKEHGLELILNIISESLKNRIDFENISIQDIDIIRKSSGKLTPDMERTIYRILNDLCSIQTGGFNDSNMKSKQFGIKPFVISTYEPAIHISKKYGKYYKFGVIDEFQEFIAHPETSISDSTDFTRTDAMLTIIQNLPHTSKIHLMTGSVNRKSLDQVKQILEFVFNRKFELLQFGPDTNNEGTKNRSDIVISPFEKMKTKDEKVKLIVDLIKNDIPYNLVVLFSTAGTHGIFPVVEECIKQLPKMREEILFSKLEKKDQSLRDIPKENDDPWFSLFMKKQKDFVNKKITQTPEAIIKPFIIPNVESRGSLLLEHTHTKDEKLYYNGVCSSGLIFKHEEGFYINVKGELGLYLFKIITLNGDYTVNLELIACHNYNGGDCQISLKFDVDEGNWNIIDKEIDRSLTTVDSLRAFFKKHETDFDKQNEIKRFKHNPVGASNLKINEIEFLKYFDVSLLKTKSPGTEINENDLIKYYNPDNPLYQAALRGIGIMIGNLHNRHKETIQKLFRENKLKVCIATDAIGVGANVNVRNLYLTTTEKFDGGAFRQVDSSSITQIVNRVGRNPMKFPQSYIYVPVDQMDYIARLVNGDPANEVGEISMDFMEVLKSHAEEIKKDNRFISKILSSLFKKKKK